MGEEPVDDPRRKLHDGVATMAGWFMIPTVYCQEFGGGAGWGVRTTGDGRVRSRNTQIRIHRGPRACDGAGGTVRPGPKLTPLLGAGLKRITEKRVIGGTVDL